MPACALHGDQPGAVAHVEDLELLARGAEVETAVGQHAVDVEHQQADRGGARSSSAIAALTSLPRAAGRAR